MRRWMCRRPPARNATCRVGCSRGAVWATSRPQSLAVPRTGEQRRRSLRLVGAAARHARVRRALNRVCGRAFAQGRPSWECRGATAAAARARVRSKPTPLASVRQIPSPSHLAQLRQQLIGDEAHAGECGRERHARPVRADDDVIDATLLPVGLELVVALLR
jgi:hypothetical protein